MSEVPEHWPQALVSADAGRSQTEKESIRQKESHRHQGVQAGESFLLVFLGNVGSQCAYAMSTRIVEVT